jgi:hypothetical protein
MIVGALSEVQTGQLPNRNQKFYFLNHLAELELWPRFELDTCHTQVRRFFS